MFILTTLPPSTVLSARMATTTPATSRTGAMHTAFGVDVLSGTPICPPPDVAIGASSFHADIIQETASYLDMALFCAKRNEAIQTSIK